VLYRDGSASRVLEREWLDMVRGMATGDQLALHALYQRSQRLVFTLAARILGNRETAEEITLDVFHDLWRRAAHYDPANGTVIGWIMNQARSRAIDRLRFDQRKKRTGPDSEQDADAEFYSAQDILELKQRGEAVRAALPMLSADERVVIETAFFSDLTHAETAARLGLPLGTVKTRIRAGLTKLRQVLADNGQRS